eukprot:6539316-Ditylum_brightwellii.AAC.1
MTVDVSEDILEWLRNLMKPKDMSVSDFAARLDHFNELVRYCPNINGINPTPLSEREKIASLKKACPNLWKNEMVRANLHITDYNELVTYYGSLKAVEPKDNNNKGGNKNKNKRKWNNNKNNNNSNNN